MITTEQLLAELYIIRALTFKHDDIRIITDECFERFFNATADLHDHFYQAYFYDSLLTMYNVQNIGKLTSKEQIINLLDTVEKRIKL